MPQAIHESWFVPLGVLVSLQASVYLFEQLEEEKGDKRIGKALFSTGCIFLSYVCYKIRSSIEDETARLSLLLLLPACLIVMAKILQE